MKRFLWRVKFAFNVCGIVGGVGFRFGWTCAKSPLVDKMRRDGFKPEQAAMIEISRWYS